MENLIKYKLDPDKLTEYQQYLLLGTLFDKEGYMCNPLRTQIGNKAHDQCIDLVREGWMYFTSGPNPSKDNFYFYFKLSEDGFTESQIADFFCSRVGYKGGPPYCSEDEIKTTIQGS